MASKKPLAAIRGFAMSDLSRQYIGPTWQLAVTAIHRAIADAGLKNPTSTACSSTRARWRR